MPLPLWHLLPKGVDPRAISLIMARSPRRVITVLKTLAFKQCFAKKQNAKAYGETNIGL